MLNASPKDDIRVPGPSKRLMREVRRYLKARGIVPVNPIWRQAWAWAKTIAESYWSAKSSRYYYPSPREVSTQYIVLLLTSMKTDGDLKLPYRAEKMPDSVRAAFAAIGGKPSTPAITFEPTE